MNFYSDQQEMQNPPPLIAFGSYSLDRKLSPHHSYCLPQEDQRFDAEIQPTDVLCGRGKQAFNNQGNRRFRDLIAASTDKYINASSRLEKSMVVHSIVEQVKKIGGRFLKQDRYTGRWYELDERQAKEKVGHAIRDATASIDPKKKEKAAKKRNSATSTSLPIHRQKVRSDFVLSMNDDSSRMNDDSSRMNDDSSRSTSSGKSDLVALDEDMDISNIEPIRHDSIEAQNSLRVLHEDDFFLKSLSSVIDPQPLVTSSSSGHLSPSTQYTHLSLEIM